MTSELDFVGGKKRRRSSRRRVRRTYRRSSRRRSTRRPWRSFIPRGQCGARSTEKNCWLDPSCVWDIGVKGCVKNPSGETYQGPMATSYQVPNRGGKKRSSHKKRRSSHKKRRSVHKKRSSHHKKRSSHHKKRSSHKKKRSSHKRRH
jgi:hypothetical protein